MIGKHRSAHRRRVSLSTALAPPVSDHGAFTEAAMPGLLIVLLTCSAGIDAADCTRSTALDVRIVGRTQLPTACALGGLMTAAREADAAGDSYPLVRCERTDRSEMAAAHR